MATEYIERDAVLTHLREKEQVFDERGKNGTATFLDAIAAGLFHSIILEVQKIPKADAVEVVRCKDCVHRHQITCPFLIANAYKASSDDDFCSKGERRADNAR